MADQAAGGLLSPFLQRRRIAAALPHLRGRVLDVGCGSGALAAHVPPDRYYGMDADEASLAVARSRYPRHVFARELPGVEPGFDTVVALAVIEHVADPCAFLRALGDRLGPSPAAIVCTTPHPAAGWIHEVGARLGLFSRDAKEEHERLLDGTRLREVASRAALEVASYRRFLLGANQLAVLRRSAP
jgi:2-polyprenyl-3-methyl-5-hydroxy-6-metoxy-1,4-benzoquinol methylase